MQSCQVSLSRGKSSPSWEWLFPFFPRHLHKSCRTFSPLRTVFRNFSLFWLKMPHLCCLRFPFVYHLGLGIAVFVVRRTWCNIFSHLHFRDLYCEELCVPVKYLVILSRTVQAYNVPIKSQKKTTWSEEFVLCCVGWVSRCTFANCLIVHCHQAINTPESSINQFSMLRYLWMIAGATLNHPEMSDVSPTDALIRKYELDLCVSWINENSFSRVSNQSN